MRGRITKSKTQNTLLVEIMISVLFFALCATVILEVFVAAREYSRRSAVEGEAMIVMRDMAEQIYAADNEAQMLEEAGFLADESGWMLEMAEYRLEYVSEMEETATGDLRCGYLRAIQADDVMAEMPVVRYFPGGAAE